MPAEGSERRLPGSIQALIDATDAGETARFRYWTEQYDHSERHESGRVIHYAKDGAIFGDTPTAEHFGLTYASWLVLPRVSLQEMPVDWQARFYALLHEAQEQHGLATPEDLYVMRRRGRRFVSNTHWNDYRYGNTVKAKQIDEKEEA